MSVELLNVLLLSAALGAIVWRGSVAARVVGDARRRGFPPVEVIRWGVIALVAEDRYWWGARLDRLPVPEARELLIDLARRHNLLNVISLRCPLCETEIKDALAVADNGELYVRRQSACSHCDFRVDACRHCAHFQPAQGDFALFERRGDFSHGRCGFYCAPEPVRTAYPRHANRIEAMGIEVLPAPRPIADSFIPLAECTAFVLKLDLLRQSHIPWLDRQRIALISLHQRVNRR